MEPITAISVALITGLCPLFIYFIKRKYEKRSPLSEMDKKLIEEKDEIFFRDFIIPNLREQYFYKKTGILTNASVIPQFIQFKEKLGAYYSWNEVKKVVQHLNLDKDEIEIKISKFQKRFCKGFSFLYLIFFLAILIFVIYFGKSHQLNNLSDILLILIILLIPAIVGFFMISSFDSIYTATSMEKRLKNREEKENLNRNKQKEG